ncbi:hypothetical protein [Aneurinibacillus terranovensis]|uniref:hypothetical protein n=1 Tax=Aneurinibacillus terranovensis TaxID=278991 RepID=UPI00040AC338
MINNKMIGYLYEKSTGVILEDEDYKIYLKNARQECHRYSSGRLLNWNPLKLVILR